MFKVLAPFQDLWNKNDDYYDNDNSIVSTNDSNISEDYLFLNS